jgi:hypothetical protein
LHCSLLSFFPLGNIKFLLWFVLFFPPFLIGVQMFLTFLTTESLKGNVDDFSFETILFYSSIVFVWLNELSEEGDVSVSSFFFFCREFWGILWSTFFRTPGSRLLDGRVIEGRSCWGAFSACVCQHSWGKWTVKSFCWRKHHVNLITSF